MVEEEAKPKKSYPVMIATILAGIAIPTVKWLVTKELTSIDYMVGVLPILAGAFSTTQVSPVKSIAPMVAEAAAQTAVRMDATAAGPPGTLTEVGQKIAADVTAAVTGKPQSLADQLIARTKAKVGR